MQGTLIVESDLPLAAVTLKHTDHSDLDQDTLKLPLIPYPDSIQYLEGTLVVSTETPISASTVNGLFYGIQTF